MLMTKTDYTIKDLVVYKNGKLRCHGFRDMGSALHAVYTIEGKKEGTEFVESDGIVYKKEVLNNLYNKQ